MQFDYWKIMRKTIEPTPCPSTSNTFSPPWPWMSNFNRTVHVKKNKSKQKQNQFTSHSNWPLIPLFNLARKQCSGIIKEWHHCPTSESIVKFLVNNILTIFTIIVTNFTKFVTNLLNVSTNWDLPETIFSFFAKLFVKFFIFVRQNSSFAVCQKSLSVPF